MVRERAEGSGGEQAQRAREAAARYRIDADRVYLTGPSLGGSGTWCIATRYPKTFAAIAPIRGFTSHLDSSAAGQKRKVMPTEPREKLNFSFGRSSTALPVEKFRKYRRSALMPTCWLTKKFTPPPRLYAARESVTEP